MSERIRYAPVAILTTAALAALLTAPAAAAYPVTVVASQPVTAQIMPELGVISGVLGEILAMQQATGTAITQSADKLGAIVSHDGQATRQQMIFNEETRRLEAARQSYTVPDAICSESASGSATQGKHTSVSHATTLSRGGGVSSRPIQQRLEQAADSRTRDAYDGSAVHAAYCTEAEYARFGGTEVCPSVGQLPGGDSQVRSVLYGAGDADTPPALTFNQAQVDAAMAYMKNTARPSAGRTPGKGEVGTITGRNYVGLQNEYNGITDAAAWPQQSLIADSTPNESTRDGLREALQSSSAAAYFDQTASPEAKANGIMSQREFEAFEAGRRYASTDWLKDLQEMQGDNLLRELVRTTAQMNWQLNDLKEHIRQGNVIAGQQLTLSARAYYTERLQPLEMKMSQGTAK
ncbi:IncI1 plasmid conjugative transfer protein TraW (plasmid) [Klebsiella sp. PL-2018]|nr:IncI1 plasmid conjugative transfer protein TraW [Klebsiella sp. PL-2018]